MLARKLALIFLAINCPVFAQPPTAKDFLPPARDGSSKVKEPEKVQTSDQGQVIKADNPQDAINAAAAQSRVELAKSPKDTAKNTQEVGFKWVQFKSGGGYVSTGMSTYKEYPNPTAGLIAQRNAYVSAYTQAKATMAQQLGQPSVTARSQLVNIHKSLNTAEKSEKSDAEVTDEEVAIVVEKLLKGYVTWEINETQDEHDPQTKFVYVSIASYPATLKASLRTGGLICTEDLTSEIEELLVEIRKGLVPPVGGRIITVPSSGSSAWIGFGSAIVEHASNPALQARNKLTAQKIASVRASDSLVGILIGDKTTFETGVSGNVKTEFQESNKYVADANKNNESTAITESALDAFTSNQDFQEIITSARSGKLPPGIQTKSWINEDGTWAYTMSVYYPDVTESIKKFAREMDSADLLAGANDQNQDATSKSNKPSPKLKTKVKPLRGGKISPEDQ